MKDYTKEMDLAIQLAQEAKQIGDAPFGAVIIDESGKIIAKAANSTQTDHSSTFHAEMNAIQQAEYNRQPGKLKGCTLISTAEPCPMCASAIVWSGLDTVVYGASIQQLKGLGIFQLDISSKEVFRHAKNEIKVIDGYEEERTIALFD